MERLQAILGHFAGLWLARPFSCLAIFALGGAFAFGYSYVPLHQSKQMRVERLEAELASEAGRGLALAERLAEMELEARLTPASDEVEDLRSERSRARQEAADLESQLASARQRVKRLETDRANFKKQASRYKRAVEDLTRERDALLTAERQRAAAPPVARVAPGAVRADEPAPAMAGTRPPAPLAVPDADASRPSRRVSPDQF